jgi:type I restriction enzyme S subunit
MKSNYNQLGQYIEMVSRTNSDLKYGIEDVRGCSNTKQMMQTRANLIGRTYEKFIVLKPREFVFNRRTTRNGEKIGMAYNNSDREYIFTNDYVAFRVKREYLDKLLPDYLYLFFCRDEFDRYARYKSTGSATEFFNWEDMCAVPFEIPPMDFQQLVVNTYKVLNERIEIKRKINDNLAATIQTIFLSCKQSDTFKTYLPLNELVKTVNFRNKDNVYGIDDLMGVSLTKEFIKSPANTISLDVSNYKIVKPFQFACNLMHVGRDKKVAVGMLTDADNVIISPAFTVFEIINNNVILPEVLVSWFSQSFFDNEVSYLASEGIRDGIKWDTFAQIPIFIPEFEIQTKIQNIYKNIQQNKLEISTLNNFADTFITTLSSR